MRHDDERVPDRAQAFFLIDQRNVLWPAHQSCPAAGIAFSSEKLNRSDRGVISFFTLGRGLTTPNNEPKSSFYTAWIRSGRLAAGEAPPFQSAHP
jgi:hypothetical protein